MHVYFVGFFFFTFPKGVSVLPTLIVGFSENAA